jgi:hypothetical protein
MNFGDKIMLKKIDIKKKGKKIQRLFQKLKSEIKKYISKNNNNIIYIYRIGNGFTKAYSFVNGDNSIHSFLADKHNNKDYV